MSHHTHTNAILPLEADPVLPLPFTTMIVVPLAAVHIFTLLSSLFTPFPYSWYTSALVPGWFKVSEMFGNFGLVPWWHNNYGITQVELTINDSVALALWSLPVLDLSKSCSLWPAFDIGPVCVDDDHRTECVCHPRKTLTSLTPIPQSVRLYLLVISTLWA